MTARKTARKVGSKAARSNKNSDPVGLPTRGKLLYLPDIMRVTGMPEGTIRSRYHRDEMPFLWKLGRRLVAWEKDLVDWMDQQRRATTKT